MDHLAMWNMIVGFVSATFILPIVQQPRWSSRVRALVTFVYSIIVGAVTAYLDGSFSLAEPRAVATSIMTVLVTAIAVYNGFAKPTGIAPAVEAATSPTPPRRRAT